jgi:hypothetical protein
MSRLLPHTRGLRPTAILRQRALVSRNPVRIRDGRATVTDPTVLQSGTRANANR